MYASRQRFRNAHALIWFEEYSGCSRLALELETFKIIVEFRYKNKNLSD
jgi:hypothetical protein